VARWEGEELTVWASTQGIFVMRDELAETLELPVSKVRVITEYMGGGFGAKFGPRIEGVTAARLAKEAGAPVKLFLDRKEEQLATGNRPSSVQTVKAGATKDGKLTALQLTVYGNGGTNGGTGTSGPIKNIYACENLKVDEYDVFTNAGPSTAMRAPGHPQGAFALEATMDELARALGIDPLEFRLRNDPSAVRREEFRIGAEKIGWAGRDTRRRTPDPWIRRGVGVGAAVWYNTGDTGPRATVTIHRDGSAEVEHGVQDLGTGSRTMVAIVAAEELGIPLEKVSVSIGDSRMPFAPDSGGSATTPGSAPTIRRAAFQARKELARAIAREWKVPPESVAVEGGRISAPGDPKHDVSWAEACKLLPSQGVAATAERAENHEDAWKRFTTGAQFAEVEVDTATGKVRVERVVAVHDCGVPINPLATESQIQGGVIQGVSYALFEDRVLDGPTGRMVNPNVESYKIAGALDVPEIDVTLVSVWDGINNTNSVGIGEPATVPTAAAIANAVSHAVGARIRQLPITPEVVLAAVREADEHAKGGRA
jgi:xanthine dehydrogenase YagR molybdenum-binding subunit